jgi:hypothetical protein
MLFPPPSTTTPKKSHSILKSQISTIITNQIWLPHPSVNFHIWQNDYFFFQKTNSFLNFEFIEFSMIYDEIVTWVMKLFKM